MHSFKTTALAAAVVLALAGGSAVAAGPTQEVRALKNTVDNLRKQLDEIKRQQARQPTDGDALQRAQVEELRKQVAELRALLQKPPAAQAEAKPGEVGAPASPDTQVAGIEESPEAIDARTPATKADIQGLRTDLENYKYDNARQLERNVASTTRNTKIGGTITVGYQTRNPGFAPSADAGTKLPAEPRKHSFIPAQVGLNFSGNLYRDYQEGRNLTYRLAFTSATNFGSAKSHDTIGQASSNGSQFNVTDAYIRYSYQPSTGNPEDPLGTITLGQQIIPFGQDPQAQDPEVKAVIGNAGFVSGLGLNTRQVGLVASGDYDPYVDFTNNYRAPLVTYAVGVFNGNGANKQDNNSNADFVARLVYTLPVDYSNWFRQLQLGVSYYRGSGELGDATTSTTGTGLYPSAGKSTIERRGFDINWTHLPYSISYEWAYGKDELLPSTANRLANPDGFKRGVGQYINFGYTWGEQFLSSSKNVGKFDDWWPKSYQAFVRYDSWDPNRSSAVRNDLQLQTTVGLNVFFAETTKFQINYLHTVTKLGTTAPTPIKPASSNGWQAQLNATF